MSAGTFDLSLEEGAQFDATVTWKDSGGALVNLTGYSAKLQIKKSYGGTALVSLTESSGITLGGAAGTITIKVTAAQATTLGANFTGVYDLLLTTAGGVPKRVLQGAATVSPRVTI